MSVIDARFAGGQGGFTLDTAFNVPAKGVTALFGPSGCGKTTVLRCIAGLNRMKEGFLSVEGEVWQQGRRFIPPHKRPIGYVFQEASLFPHLSVTGNLRFGLHRTKNETPRILFDDVVALLGLSRLLDRPASVLSGGERQRVAIGRALLSQPRLLLMDEPLSALDRFSKDDILPYLERLHSSLSIPVLYVSHDISEVERLADHLVLMESGRVKAAGPLEDLLADPALPLAGMPEAAVALNARMEGYDPAWGLSTLAVHGATLLVPANLGPVGSAHRLRILSSDVSLSRSAPQGSTIINSLAVRILSAEPLGEHQMNVLVRLGPDGAGARLLARITRKSWMDLAFQPGETVYAQIKGVALVDRSL
ncbi:molybdenum ABC transporter ATP-binding protein [Telmatospirillum sp. J64-1]|uniref:molybdenum ABC transporter ATP-binding protein n=1 Tax=Telmatospirillum sp. J64-1 TaxID=2502183 RepID=UPI00115D5C33|nr:molybdenum ABC transporter ATP-binding protein [Telmatospirillum sp. J64-1]